METAFCPGCNCVPGVVMGDISFCVNDRCWVVCWDNTMSLDELLVDVSFMRLGISE